MQVKEQSPEQSQFLTFQVSGDRYAIGIMRIREIVEYRTVTRVPMLPECVRGVINLRGNVVAVIDLASRFGLGRSTAGRRTCIVIVETALDGAGAVMGVMADSVCEVVELGKEAIQAPPAFGAPIPVDYVSGLGRIGDDFILVLDLDRTLAVGTQAALRGASGSMADEEALERDAPERPTPDLGP